MSGPASEAPDPGRELRLDLPAAHSAARMARQVVREFALAAAVPAEEIDTLLLITDELLTNAVDHGGGNAALDEADLERPVRMELELELSDDGWRLVVSDEGHGDPRDVEALLHPDGLPDLEDERGRGLFLVAQMCAEIHARSRANGLGLAITAVRAYGAGG